MTGSACIDLENHCASAGLAIRTFSASKHARRPGSRFSKALRNLVNSTKRWPEGPSDLSLLTSGQGGAALITKRSAAPFGTCSTARATSAGLSSSRLPRWDVVVLGDARLATKNGRLVNLPGQNVPNPHTQARRTPSG